MTKTKKSFIHKYLSLIDKSTFNHNEGGVVTEVVDAEYVRALLTEMIREYEHMNTVPKVDFWGQPI